MKKRMLMLIVLCCLLFGGCGANEVADANLLLEKPDNITLQNASATKSDAVIYQIGNSVVMVKADVNNLRYVEDGSLDRIFLTEGDIYSWLRFHNSESLSFYAHKNEGIVATMNVLSNEEIAEKIAQKERINIENGVFCIVDDYWVNAYIALGEGMFLDFGNTSYGCTDEEDIKEFEKELKNILELIEVFPGATTDSTHAVSLREKVYDLSQYMTVEDVLALEYYNIWGMNVQDSKNIKGFIDDYGVKIIMEDTEVVFEAETEYFHSGLESKEYNFAEQIGKFTVYAILKDNIATEVFFVNDGKVLLSTKELSIDGVTDSGEHFKDFLKNYFGE